MSQSKLSVVQAKFPEQMNEKLATADEGQVVYFLSDSYSLFYRQKGSLLERAGVLDKHQLYGYICALKEKNPEAKLTVKQIIQLDLDDSTWKTVLFFSEMVILCLAAIVCAATGYLGIHVPWILAGLSILNGSFGAIEFDRGNVGLGLFGMLSGTATALGFASAISSPIPVLITLSIIGLLTTAICLHLSNLKYGRELFGTIPEVDEVLASLDECPMDGTMASAHNQL